MVFEQEQGQAIRQNETLSLSEINAANRSAGASAARRLRWSATTYLAALFRNRPDDDPRVLVEVFLGDPANVVSRHRRDERQIVLEPIQSIDCHAARQRFAQIVNAFL